MNQAKLAWNLMTEAQGSYQGRGVNHEGQDFTGDIKIETAFPEKALSVFSQATGDDGEIYHKEVSWLGFDTCGAFNLYVTSNNHPAITTHAFHRLEDKGDVKNVVFRFGNLEDRQSFREEVTFSFYQDGSVAHHYAWGPPGGDFEPRSGSKMKKI